MYLVEIAPKRWTVRTERYGKFLGMVEYHEFFTYTKTGRRVKSGFWIGRLPANGWKDSDWGGWKRAKTKDEAITSLSKRKNARKDAQLARRAREAESN